MPPSPSRGLPTVDISWSPKNELENSSPVPSSTSSTVRPASGGSTIPRFKSSPAGIVILYASDSSLSSIQPLYSMSIGFPKS